MYKVTVKYREDRDCNDLIYTARISVINADVYDGVQDFDVLWSDPNYQHQLHSEFSIYPHNSRHCHLMLGYCDKDLLVRVVERILKETKEYVNKLRKEKRQQVFEHVF